MLSDALTFNLLASAGLVAAAHTALGPDHTLPFVMLARARGWSLRRTLAITALCGAGHVLSSVLLGGIGVLIGISTGALQSLEGLRGDLAAWAMVLFGAAYGLWGLRQALRRGQGIELHTHGGLPHLHLHGDRGHFHGASPARGSAAARTEDEGDRRFTFWALFVVFVLGPCEPLIPLLILPAQEGRWSLALWTTAVFAVVTLATMLGMVAAASRGLSLVPTRRLERWSHSLAGAVISLSGLAILFLGL
ncbi:MAG: hypothetical protein IPK67_07905 [Planctomycetes bacterium]|jgi:nickel/cobalt exporter|nr:hypothetical protein [Planctomycetota bacterium]